MCTDMVYSIIINKIGRFNWIQYKYGSVLQDLFLTSKHL